MPQTIGLALGMTRDSEDADPSLHLRDYANLSKDGEML